MTAVRLIYNLQFTIYNKFSILKFSFLFLLVTCYLLLVTSSVSAQTHQPAAFNPQQLPANQYIPNQSPHFASIAIYNFGHAMSCIMIGQSPISPCLEYQYVRDAQGMVKAVPYLSNVNTSNGVLGMSLSMIGEVISTPPIRSSEFIANLGEQLGVREAHAQVGGSGSGVLAPIFKLWEVSRNIAYLAMIVIFIIVGLMVMFRQKLNPQTVVTIQMALPGLVVGLVMITFSYFLASLISDMAFVGTNVVGYYFSLAQGGTGPIQPPLITSSGEQNVLNVFSRYTGIIDKDIASTALSSIWDDFTEANRQLLTFLAAAVIFQTTFQATSVAQIIPGIGSGIHQIVSAVTAGIAAKNPTAMVGLTISWIASIVLIYSMFKLLLRLIQNLLHIIFLTIAAPFYFLAASLPGRQGLATNWMFNMLCNVLAFPAIVGVFYFVVFLLGKSDPALPIVGASVTALANNSTFPLLGGLDLKFLNILLAFGALTAAPSIPDVICKSVGKPGAFGGIIAGGIGGNMAAGQRYGNQITQGLGGFGERGGGLWNKRAFAQVKTPEDAVRLGEMEKQDLWEQPHPKFPGKTYQDVLENQYIPTTLSYYGGQLGGLPKGILAVKRLPSDIADKFGATKRALGRIPRPRIPRRGP